MIVLIYDGQIAGMAESTENLPLGFTAIEFEGEHSLHDLYLSAGDELLLKPPQPSDEHYWDLTGDEWVLPSIPSPPALPDWGLLAHLLVILPVWARVYDEADVSLPVNNAFTMLQTVIASIKSTERLEVAIAKLRASITGGLQSDEITDINDALTAAHFDLQLVE